MLHCLGTVALDGMLPWSNKIRCLYIFPQLNYTRKAKNVAKLSSILSLVISPHKKGMYPQKVKKFIFVCTGIKHYKSTFYIPYKLWGYIIDPSLRLLPSVSSYTVFSNSWKTAKRVSNSIAWFFAAVKNRKCSNSNIFGENQLAKNSYDVV